MVEKTAGLKGRVLHIAEVEICESSGMGRVAWHWRNAFQHCGYEFVHVGPSQVGETVHRALFAWAARNYCKRLKGDPCLILVHEPASGSFVKRGIPTVVFSHGLERRGAEIMAEYPEHRSFGGRIRAAMTSPLWKVRSFSREKGLRNATAALLINQEDATFAREHYGLAEERTFVFRNGVVYRSSEKGFCKKERILFLGSWLKRKGTEALAAAARILATNGVTVEWILAGTGASQAAVLAEWPTEAWPFTKVIPNFTPAEEEGLFSQCGIFVLPSLFEGQPLALLQAMAFGKCCITTDSCGQRDLITHNVNGLLHEPNDAPRLAALITRAIAEPALPVRLGQHASDSVAGRTWESVSAEVVAYVESVSRASGCRKS